MEMKDWRRLADDSRGAPAERDIAQILEVPSDATVEFGLRLTHGRVYVVGAVIQRAQKLATDKTTRARHKHPAHPA